MSTVARTLTVKLTDASTQVVSLPANDLRDPDAIVRDIMTHGVWISPLHPKGDAVGAVWVSPYNVLTVTVS
jgi:hypothetical protein